MRQQRVICLILFVVTVALYAPVINHEFLNYDDDLYITDERIVHQGLTWAGIRWAFTGYHASNWHPVTWLSHMLDCSLFGLDPAGHHLTSVLFHALNAVLVFLLLRRITRWNWRSALVAALFAWHPLHVESVAWVAERKDVLSTFFGLLAIRSYAVYAQQDRRRTPYLLAILWYALSLMAKPMLVTLPFLLILLDYWPLARLSEPWRSNRCSPDASEPGARSPANVGWLLGIREKVPFAFLSIISCALTVWAQHMGKAVTSLEVLPMHYRFLNAVTAYAAYIGKTLWPKDLAVLYPLPMTWPWSQVLLASLLLAGITTMVLVTLRRQPFLAVGWFWFLGTLVPVIGLVQVGSQAMADRYSYVPLIGLFIMVAGTFGALAANRPRLTKPLTVGVTGLLVVCALLTRLQLRHWRDSIALYERAIAVTQNNFIAHGNLGVHLLETGQVERSIACFRDALRIWPTHQNSHINLGLALAEAGRPEEAQPYFEKALQLNTNSVKANYFMGVSLASHHRYAEAKPFLLQAIALAPDEFYFRQRVALIMAKQDDLTSAIEQFSEILRRNPNDGFALYNLGTLYARLGRWEEAISLLNRSLQIDRDSIETLRSLAWILATAESSSHRNGRLAVQYAERAVELSKEPDAYALDTLGAAYAEAGRFPDAVATARKALELAEQQKRHKLVAELRTRLQKYESGCPYRQGKETR